TVRRRAAPNFIRLALLLACLATLAVFWRSSPLVSLLDPKALETSMGAVSDSPFALFWVTGVYIIVSLIFVPVTLLIVATEVVFDPLPAFFYALCGSCVSALVGYSLGKLVGRETVY